MTVVFQDCSFYLFNEKGKFKKLETFMTLNLTFSLFSFSIVAWWINARTAVQIVIIDTFKTQRTIYSKRVCRNMIINFQGHEKFESGSEIVSIVNAALLCQGDIALVFYNILVQSLSFQINNIEVYDVYKWSSIHLTF